MSCGLRTENFLQSAPMERGVVWSMCDFHIWALFGLIEIRGATCHSLSR